MPNLDKQHHKLMELQTLAEQASSREEARKILKAAAKAQRKINEAHDPYYFLR